MVTLSNLKLNNKKFGFSLVEVLISMLILSVVFMAMTNVAAHKAKKKLDKSPHGFYECYKIGGTLYEDITRNNAAKEDNENVDSCIFNPPKGAYIVNVYYIDSDKYMNTQESMFTEQLELTTPENILNEYDDVLISKNLDDEDRIKVQEDFKSYLEISHPQSKVLSTWNTTGSIPDKILFIAW